MKVLGGSVIDRGRKNRTNIRKHVVKKPAMLTQTIRLRVLNTLGSGADSTTTAGGFAAGLAAGGAAVGGMLAVADFSWLGTLSNPKTSVSQS